MTADDKEKTQSPSPVAKDRSWLKRGLGIFRWGGLVPFVIIVGGLWVFGYLFADPIARSVLESNLTRIQGAQVDVVSADVSWQPFGLVAEGLAFTDPNQPEQNALDIETVSMQMDFLGLLTGKIVFESLAVDGLRFNTARSAPGRVLDPPEPVASEEPSVAEQALDTVELPSPSEALERHGTLETEERAEAALETRDRVVDAVQQSAGELPDEETLQSYRERLQRLQEAEVNSIEDVQRIRQEVITLTEDVRRDRQAILTFLETVDSADDELTDALEALLAAPGEDIANLRATYNLSPEGQVALAGLLLGDQWAEWVATGHRWYATAEPWITRLMNWKNSRDSDGAGYVPPGYYVTFPEDNPVPGFWLKEATVSAFTDAGDWGGNLIDLSSDPALIDRPARLNASSTRLDAAEAADLGLVWDWREDNIVQVDFDVDAWEVGGWQIQDEELPIGLSSATSQMDLDATYHDGWQGTLDWQFNNSDFGIPEEWRSGNLLRQALEAVDQFSVTAELGGDSLFPSTRWSSDLDQQFADAVENAVGAQVAQWESEIRADLEARQEEFEEQVRTELARLESLEEEWSNRRDALEEEVLATLNNVEDELVNQREQLEGRIDEEREALEQRAREEQEAIEQRLQEEREAAERRAREEAESRAEDLLQGLGF